jgi:flagellar protein FliO/FliZ
LLLFALGAGTLRLGAQGAGGDGAPAGGAPAGTPGGLDAGAARPDEREIRLGEESPDIPLAAPGPVSGFVILRTVLLLILAAVAVYGLVYLVKKLSRPRDALNPDLRVLATTRLGPGRFVHVVALGTRAWLVGAGEGGISHIADVTEQEALDTLFLEESRRAAAGPGRPPDFRSLLRRLGVGAQDLPAAASPPAAPPDQEAESPDRRFPAGDPESRAEQIRRRSDRLRGL